MKFFGYLLFSSTLACAITLAIPSPVVLPAIAADPAHKSASPAGVQPDRPLSASHAARAEKALQDARRQMLDEKEAALAIKEQELKRLTEKLDTQLKALEDNKKRLEEGRKTKDAADKKLQEDKLQKMVKLFKTMRGEQAGKLIDSLPESQALTLLSRLDTKTVAKLAAFINQPRVVKWISENIGSAGN